MKLARYLSIGLIALSFCFTEPAIAQKWFNEYPLPTENSHPRTEKITHVVLHFTSNVTNKPDNPYNIKDIHMIFIKNGVSAHYMIDRKGRIYSLVPEKRVAYHAGKGNFQNFPEYKNKLNEFSIGIELLGMGTKEEMKRYISEEKYDSIDSKHIGYTEAQYKSLKKLLKQIYEQNPQVHQNRNHVIGHDEYAPNRRSDPGSLFDWSKIGL
ncbi:N-acetylmuramoyl-L-alanine amidase [Salinibacillus xinjiangensis]|uniref:N-acetylmuramoyl-L-alanine amidase n=1 Tax=Salinibacillus xinjiangensis TaxID=1229268 RepID=A0A6G1X288_9BACI|nr:N-acetylmuramoyl-L-alanine amidase [Salinibacillus xinjiangensis]MRG85006.1 N-acetylmuramoyl-L-alanine amidase [Salinibacillus xinjiangensis]